MMRQLGNWVFKQNDSLLSTNLRAISKNRMADHEKCPLPLPFLVVRIALAFCAAV